MLFQGFVCWSPYISFVHHWLQNWWLIYLKLGCKAIFHFWSKPNLLAIIPVLFEFSLTSHLHIVPKYIYQKQKISISVMGFRNLQFKCVMLPDQWVRMEQFQIGPINNDKWFVRLLKFQGYLSWRPTLHKYASFEFPLSQPLFNALQWKLSNSGRSLTFSHSP